MNKKLVVLGGRRKRHRCRVLAKTKGYEVFVSDKGTIKDKYKSVLSHFEIKFEESVHTESLILNADEIIKSPGIPDKAEIIAACKNAGLSIIDEIEFAGRYAGNAKSIRITGSNGKTTTTLLTYHILKKAGLNVMLAGNVGQSFAMQVATKEYDFYVIEISSFQLDHMYDFKADIAVLMNITPDHLDRYDYSFENYIKAKFRIIRNMTEKDSFIYCFDEKL